MEGVNLKQWAVNLLDPSTRECRENLRKEPAFGNAPLQPIPGNDAVNLAVASTYKL
jgi:hypothetical protein